MLGLHQANRFRLACTSTTIRNTVTDVCTNTSPHLTVLASSPNPDISPALVAASLPHLTTPARVGAREAPRRPPPAPALRRLVPDALARAQPVPRPQAPGGPARATQEESCWTPSLLLLLRFANGPVAARRATAMRERRPGALSHRSRARHSHEEDVGARVP